MNKLRTHLANIVESFGGLLIDLGWKIKFLSDKIDPMEAQVYDLDLTDPVWWNR